MKRKPGHVRISIAGLGTAVILGIALTVASCSDNFWRKHPSYESKFPDTIDVHFPIGYEMPDFASVQSRIDSLMRSEKIGFYSGVMGGDGAQIDFLSLDTDFDQIDEEAFARSLVEDGTLPKVATFKYTHRERSPPGTPPPSSR